MHFSKDHLIHHEHTLNNMDLKKSNQYNKALNKYLGLYFTWTYTLMILFVGLIEGLILYFLLSLINIKIKIIYVFLFVIIFSIYQTSFWNTIHPDIHNISENITFNDGIPGFNIWKIIFSSIYISSNLTLYEWFKINHTLHHLRKDEKKGNYNVTLPGADFIFGKMYFS